MGGFEDQHGGIINDWVPPSPSTRSYFAAMLSDDGQKYDTKNDNNFTFRDPNRQITLEKGDQSSEQKTSSRGGLVERMAARAGHNAPKLNTEMVKLGDNLQSQQVRSPYLTIPPGLSPTCLLESPVFVSNSLVQPSPTTGKFQFALTGNDNVNGRSSMMFSDSSNRSKDNFFEDTNNASFAFKPFADSAPLTRDHVNPPFMSTQSFQSNGLLLQSEKHFPPQKIEPETSSLHIHSSFSIPPTEKKPEVSNFSLQMAQERSQERHDESEQKVSGDIANNSNNNNNNSSEDGFNWRKYGQKQVKGSEYPRSYYKCTHPNCPVKKKVERSHEGHITEIIYKGNHNHPKLAQTRRSNMGSSSALSDMQGDVNEQGGNGNGNGNGSVHWGQESNFEVTSSGIVATMQGQNGHFESSDAVDGSLTFSNDEEEEDRVTHGSVSLGYDNEGDESESKRRKVEAYAADVSGATRAIREPRVVVQTTSEVDILDDGYRWRKYGQKVVKGNPNPRSYYKCTSTGCTVRKHVERASHDLKSVITTYEGKHNHDVPAARNSNHANNHTQSLPVQPQVQTTMARFERPPYSLVNGQVQGQGQQLGLNPNHGYGGYPMNQHGPRGLAHMAMANQQVFNAHNYLGQRFGQQQQRGMNEMGLVMPKGEPKVEPVSDPGLTVVNGAPVYRQMMNRLPM